MIYVILAVGLILRLISVNQSLWLDEATSALVARMSFSQIFTRFLPGDFHPPFYYLLLKLWTGIFGYSEIAIRIPSVIFGILTIVMVYLIGKKIFDRKVALMSSILLATSGLHVYYSQEARMYALAAFLVGVSVYLFISESWIAFSVILCLVGMTDYVSLMIIPVFWIVAIAGKHDAVWWRKFLISHIPLAGFFAVWMSTFLKQLVAGINLSVSAPGWWNILGPVTFKNIALIPVKFIFGRVSIDNKIIYGLIAGITIAIFLYILLRAKKSLLLWVWLGVSLFLGIILSFFIPTLTYFRYLFILPAFYIILGRGVSSFKKPWSTVFLIFVLSLNTASTLTYLLIPRFRREDWRSLVSFVESKKTKDSKIIFVADSNTEAYRYYAPNAKIAGPEGVRTGYDQLWLMRYVKDVFDPKDTVKMKVESLGYKKAGEYNFNGIGVWEYIKK